MSAHKFNKSPYLDTIKHNNPVLTPIQVEMLKAIISGTASKNLFSELNKIKLSFLLYKGYIKYDTSVYPQKLVITELGVNYLKDLL